jgi:endonuclease/exonuclease/phosphatase (EEP) superfamily protein YafD
VSGETTSRSGSCAGGLLSAATWALAIPLLFLAVVHVTTDDRDFYLQLLHAMSAWLYAPAVPLLAISVLRRRTAEVLLLGAIVVMWGAMHRPPWPSEALRDGPTLRIVSANALMVNETPDLWVEEILRYDADLVLVQELTPPIDALLGEAYPYHHAQPAWHSLGIGAYSRWPLHDAAFASLEPVDMQRLVVDVDGTPTLVWNVHTMPPFNPPQHRLWLAQLATLAEESARVSGPLVLAGDLNLTRHHQSYADLARQLTDAYRDCGRVMAWTWPSGGAMGARIFPKLRLDHVWLGNGARCAHIEEGVGYGSDHRPIRIEVRLP